MLQIEAYKKNPHQVLQAAMVIRLMIDDRYLFLPRLIFRSCLDSQGTRTFHSASLTYSGQTPLLAAAPCKIDSLCPSQPQNGNISAPSTVNFRNTSASCHHADCIRNTSDCRYCDLYQPFHHCLLRKSCRHSCLVFVPGSLDPPHGLDHHIPVVHNQLQSTTTVCSSESRN